MKFRFEIDDPRKIRTKSSVRGEEKKGKERKKVRKEGKWRRGRGWRRRERSEMRRTRKRREYDAEVKCKETI